MKLRCDCGEHTVEISKYNCTGTKGVSIAIFDLCSEKGRKLKKPRLSGDVVIMNNAYPKEFDKFAEFMKKICK